MLPFYSHQVTCAPPPCPLPFYSTGISAGFPSPADDHQEEAIDLNEALIIHPSSTYLIRAQGDSMMGAGIFDQDLLIVDRSITAVNGSIVIAAVDGDFTVKRLRIADTPYGEQIILAPENPDYPELYVQDKSLSIWGVVRHAVRDVLVPTKRVKQKKGY